MARLNIREDFGPELNWTVATRRCMTTEAKFDSNPSHFANRFDVFVAPVSAVVERNSVAGARALARHGATGDGPLRSC